MQGQRAEDFMFVKVNMDGVPVGRTIDLKVYKGYDALACRIEDMFKKTIAARSSGERIKSLLESNTPELLRRGANYALVYENNEGERMLVGDIPWEKFITTVKRLWVISSADARELVVDSRPDEVSQP